MTDDKKSVVTRFNNKLRSIYSYMTLILTNSNDVIVNSLSLIDQNKIIDVNQRFSSKLDAIDTIVGLAPETLNTLAKLREAINNDSTFYQNLIRDL